VDLHTPRVRHHGVSSSADSSSTSLSSTDHARSGGHSNTSTSSTSGWLGGVFDGGRGLPQHQVL